MAIEQDKKARVTISIPEELLSKVDKAALKEYTNRSQWIIYAMLEKLRRSDSLSDAEQEVHKRKDDENDLFGNIK
jgi:metal-responsive CopG/Arc/MetJ family transcriptional regulator